jgi:hypothetical protein
VTITRSSVRRSRGSSSTPSSTARAPSPALWSRSARPLRAAARDPGRLTRRVEDQRRDALWARYAHLAQFARVLASLDLKATAGDEPLLDAVRYVEDNREPQLLPDAPREILSPTYRAWVVDEHGRIVRARYEFALWLAARDALRARRLYRAGSHRYGDPAACMMPQAQWAAERVELAAVSDRPLDPGVRLEQLHSMDAVDDRWFKYRGHRRECRS